MKRVRLNIPTPRPLFYLMAQNAVFGINSNLDTQDIINKMVSLEARPMDLVEAKKQIEQQKLSSFQELKNKLQTFKGAVGTLNTESRYIVNKSVFSNNSSSDTNKVIDITTTSSASWRTETGWSPPMLNTPPTAAG